MQQTEKYKLNLIEMSDTFSPEPLNENMEALEAALTDGLAAEAAARQSIETALGRRVSTLEGRRYSVGTYTGDGTTGNNGQTVYVGFTPSAVLIQGTSGTTLMCSSSFSFNLIKLVSGGFQVRDSSHTNRNNEHYCYFAVS